MSEEIKNYKPISAEWIAGLTEFNTFITNTVRGGECPLHELVPNLTNFYKRNLPDSTIFIAFEPHANGIGYHAHAMVRITDDRVRLLTPRIKPDGKPLYCRRLHTKALRQFGRCSISEIKNYQAVVNYSQKRVFDYATKDNKAVFKILFGNSQECRDDYHRCKFGPKVAYPTL